MVAGKNGPRTNGRREKWSSDKWSPRKMVSGKNGPRTNGPREKWSPENWSPGNSKPKNRGEKSMKSMKTPNSTTNPKLGNKRETRKQKIVGWASSIVVCVWNVRMSSIYENPKLDNKHKTRKQSQNRKQKIVGWALSIVVCVCVECSDVINLWKSKTRQFFLDSFSVLQFGTYLGSWRKRQTFFCVCSGINWWKWKVV